MSVVTVYTTFYDKFVTSNDYVAGNYAHNQIFIGPILFSTLIAISSDELD